MEASLALSHLTTYLINGVACPRDQKGKNSLRHYLGTNVNFRSIFSNLS
jgi:hypothetical protein